MCIVNSIEFIDKLEGRTGCNVFIDDKQTIRWYGDFQKRHILMQYTGLKDCNGVEIYEGDVVKWDDMSDGTYWRIAEVIWDDKEALFVYRILSCIHCKLSKGYVFGGNFMYRDGKALEVIGNIHENPELL